MQKWSNDENPEKDIGPQAMDEKGNTCIVGEC
jgi:hypothetical protein